MNLVSKLLLFSLFVLTTNCGGTSAEDQKLLEEAAKIHEKAIEIEQKVKPRLDALIQEKNRINVQGRELAEAEVAFVSQVEALEKSYAFWEENHVEVPGFEHDHHHHHGHDHDHDHDHSGHDHSHDHKPGLEVTAADMLIIQKEFRDSITSIQTRAEKIKMPDRLDLE